MIINFENKYRIIEDDFSGYEAQIKYWWFPLLWFEMNEPGFMSNTWHTLDRAKSFVEKRKKNNNKKTKVVYWESNK